MQTVDDCFGLLQHKKKFNIPGLEVLNPYTNFNTKYPKVVSPNFPCQLLMQFPS